MSGKRHYVKAECMDLVNATEKGIRLRTFRNKKYFRPSREPGKTVTAFMTWPTALRLFGELRHALLKEAEELERRAKRANEHAALLRSKTNERLGL